MEMAKLAVFRADEGEAHGGCGRGGWTPTSCPHYRDRATISCREKIIFRSLDPGADGQLEAGRHAARPGCQDHRAAAPPAFVVRSELRAELDAGAAADVVLVALRPATGRRCCSRTGRGPAPRWTPRGWVSTATTTTRSACGHPWWPRSPVARRCRAPVGCTTRGPGSTVPVRSSSASSPTHCRHCRRPSG